MARKTALVRRGRTVNSRTKRAVDNKFSVQPRACYRMVRGGGRVR